MSDIPIDRGSVDLIWAEGSAYIMGVEAALKSWRPYLKDKGFLVFSDMVWHSDQRSEQAEAFWLQEYPDMQTVVTRQAQIKQAGYTLLDDFRQSDEAWMNYYAPLKDRVSSLEKAGHTSRALADIKYEVEISQQFKHEFGYHMSILQMA